MSRTCSIEAQDRRSQWASCTTAHEARGILFWLPACQRITSSCERRGGRVPPRM